MDCFHDFCLACDKESNGPYCSQSCRLADLERASPNVMSPASTTSPTASHSRLSWSSTTSTSPSAYVLSPAYDFTDKAGRPQTSYFMRHDTVDSTPVERSLTPSSSRTSLSSTTSTTSSTSATGLSEQSRQELSNYFSSFSRDKAAANRRKSLR